MPTSPDCFESLTQAHLVHSAATQYFEHHPTYPQTVHLLDGQVTQPHPITDLPTRYQIRLDLTPKDPGFIVSYRVKTHDISTPLSPQLRSHHSTFITLSRPYIAQREIPVTTFDKMTGDVRSYIAPFADRVDPQICDILHLTRLALQGKQR